MKALNTKFRDFLSSENKIKCVLAVTEVIFRLSIEVSTTAAFNPSSPVRKGEKNAQKSIMSINYFYQTQK